MRFSGFTDEWNEVKLGDISKSITKGTTPKKYSDTGINFVKVESIENNKIYKIDAFIDENTHKNELSRSILKTNDLLFSIAGSLGRTTIVTENILPANTNQALSIIRFYDNCNCNLNFIQSRLNTYDIAKYIFQNLAVGAQPNLNLQQVGNIKIRIPSFNEQNKIQGFLECVDIKIELLKKKYQQYQEFKKYLMQQIFTQKLRFADFNNSSWKDYKFKDLGTVKSGVGFSNKYQGHLDLDYNFYKVSDMNLKGNEKVMTRSNNTIDDNLLKDIGVKLIENPSIIFAKVGEAIFLNRKRIAKQPFLIDNNMMAFSPNENVDLEFMYYLATSINFGKYAQTGALPSYNASDIYSIKCKIPPIEEQKRIGKLLSLADNKIDFCSNQINKVLDFKKGLLQQMFV